MTIIICSDIKKVYFYVMSTVNFVNQGVSCPPRSECGMTCPALCLIPERWMGSRKRKKIIFFNSN